MFIFGLLQVYIAAFAISGYSTATFRNRYKPFNPVLGETYECIREDRGFHYISEQVGLSVTNVYHDKCSSLSCDLQILGPIPILTVLLMVYNSQFHYTANYIFQDNFIVGANLLIRVKF